MAHLKTSIVKVKANKNCLAHAIIIAVAKLTNETNYKSYRREYKVLPQVRQLLQTTGINLDNGAGIPELMRFQEHFSEYRIVVSEDLNCDQIMYDGQVDSSKRISLLYDYVTRHYHVINNLNGVMAKRYVCKACNKGCERDVTHICDQTCSDCMTSPPCIFSGVRIPCGECNRHFRSQPCVDNHKKRSGVRKKTVCEKKRCCEPCGCLVTNRNHECNTHFVKHADKTDRQVNSCIAPLRNELPPGDKGLYIFYVFETTQNIRYSDNATVHEPNLVCLQQFCSECESIEDIQDCLRCGKRKHSFWNNPVGDLLSYMCQSRPWVNKVIAIAHNAKSFDLHFILSRAIMLKWRPKLIMNGLKIMCMKIEHIMFLDSLSYLPLPLHKLSEAFGLNSFKSFYPHYFNTPQNLEYVGPVPDILYYGANEMSESERRDFLV
jgi:hypothetical protein